VEVTCGPSRKDLAFQSLGAGGILVVGLTLAYTSLKLPIICPLRLMTGVPCPLCGMTTGVVSILSGEFTGAAAANPFSFPFLVSIGAMVIDRTSRLLLQKPLPPLPKLRPRLVVAVLLALTVASWISQLIRFQVFS